jgi:hypothetical protein
VADDACAIWRKVALKHSVGEGGVNHAGDVARSTLEVGQTSGQTVIAAAVSWMLWQSDHKASSHKVTSQIAISPWRAIVAVRQNYQWEMVANRRRIRRDVKRIGPKLFWTFRARRRIKQRHRDGGALDCIIQFHETTTDALIHICSKSAKVHTSENLHSP